MNGFQIIFNFILISNLFSKFKSGKNYGLGFAERKPHRFNEINVMYIECARPNLGALKIERIRAIEEYLEKLG